ncbi:MAG: hypothetical protein ACOYD4_09540 [Solirubrobacterales bacterium]
MTSQAKPTTPISGPTIPAPTTVTATETTASAADATVLRCLLGLRSFRAPAP